MAAASTFLAHKAVRDKQTTKKILDKAGVNTPKGLVVNKDEVGAATDWFQQNLIERAVIKPVSGSLGRDVVTNIETAERLRQLLEQRSETTTIAEEEIPGAEYRLFVLGGHLISATHRKPANVVGDGVSTIEQLVDLKNQERATNPFNSRHPIPLGKTAQTLLENCQMTTESIPRLGETVYLQRVSNIGAGGDSIDVTDKVHEDFIAVARTAVSAFPHLDYCGIDIMAADISAPASEQKWAILEMNANADIPIHHWPSEGKSRDVAGAIAEFYFPESRLSTDKALTITISGKVTSVGLEEWLGRSTTSLGLTGKILDAKQRALTIHIEGSEASINAFLSQLAKPTQKAIINSVSIVESDIQGFEFFHPITG